MTKIMIVGAHGAMAQLLTDRLLNETQVELTLFLRDAARLNRYADNPRVTLVDGDVKDTALVAKQMTGTDLVYSNLGGPDLADQTQSVLTAMKQTNTQRFVYISALGAHHEVPGKFGEWNEQAIAAFLPGFRKTAQLVADSGLTYTEIRPAWLTDNDEVDYEETQLGEDFQGTEVSRKSVADFTLKVITHQDTYQNASIGLDKAGTAGDQPSWI
ncbi:NAD(P)H-binding protein [Levilactobacillus brevis]|nr:NAD(P)H-binding protein [Levilactobacillus brevis]